MSLIDYLNEKQREGSVSAETVAHTLNHWAWAILLLAEKGHHTDRERVQPDACPGADGQMLLTWDRSDPERHLECEVFPDGRGEWYRTGAEGAPNGYVERSAEEPLPEDLRSALAEMWCA